MLDITPHSLGTDYLDYYNNEKYAILIPRNTQLPCVASRLFYKSHPLQKAVKSLIYQGESPRLKDNVELGVVTLDGLEDNGDETGICVKFEMDRSGILHVTSTDVTTGKKVELVIEKESSSRMQTVNLADLKMLRMSIEDDSVVLDETEESLLEDVEEAAVTVNDQLIERALAALAKASLSPADKVEIEESLALVQSGGSSEKLESILYYID